MDRRKFLEYLRGAAGAAALTPFIHSASKTYTFEDQQAGKTLKNAKGETVLSYLIRKPDRVPLAGNSVCCFHPINTLAGERVTDIAPADHRDHRGLFFAWDDMTFHRKGGDVKADFWGWGRFAPTDARVIENRSLKLVQADTDGAEIAIRNDWIINGQKVLDEATTAIVRDFPDVRVLDTVWHFRSDSDFTINRCAFTGFCLRCRKDGDYYISDRNGRVTLPDPSPLHPDSDWPPRDWYSHTIRVTDSGKTVAAAVLDHPLNPKSLWHEPHGVAFLNPCIAATASVSVAAGEAFVLRYRVVLHDGEFAIGLLDRLTEEWRGN